MTRLTLVELKAMPPARRHKETLGTIFIPFPRDMKPGQIRVRTMNDSLAYFWDAAHEKKRS